MEIIINTLIESAVDKFITGSEDRYMRVVLSEQTDNTVDLYIKAKTVAIDSDHIIIEFPNSTVLAVNISSVNYYKIEVL